MTKKLNSVSIVGGSLIVTSDRVTSTRVASFSDQF